MKASSITRFIVNDRGNSIFLLKFDGAAHVITAGASDGKLSVGIPCPCCQSPDLGEVVGESIRAARADGFLPENLTVYWRHWAPGDEKYLPLNPAFVAEKHEDGLEERIVENPEVSAKLLSACAELRFVANELARQKEAEERKARIGTTLQQLMSQKRFADAQALAQLTGTKITKELLAPHV